MKSYSFWTALSGALVIFIKSICKMFGVEIQDEIISSIVLGFASILVVFGVITMPSKEDENKEIEIKNTYDDE
ncbi:MAG: hypothetical protein IJ008_02695 [Clostridia bacterium]|nr:hypothetical protein [Clostridia bacterium]